MVVNVSVDVWVRGVIVNIGFAGKADGKEKEEKRGVLRVHAGHGVVAGVEEDFGQNIGESFELFRCGQWEAIGGHRGGGVVFEQLSQE